VLKKFPKAKLGIGPAINEGFYYDFDLQNSITEDDLKDIEQIMQNIINEKQVLFLKTTLGYITSSDINDETVFIDEYYIVGNSRTVRGYSETNPFAYGNKQVIATIEYRYIFSPTVTAYLFTDVGYATKFRQEDNTFVNKSIYDLSEYKLTKGIGTKLTIAPIGPIKLDFGITETGVSRLQFNMGYSF
tara:strand:+ start:2446 stop:3009 length:564 start_codon:yes stop_codon:yes gene_type:complete